MTTTVEDTNNVVLGLIRKAFLIFTISLVTTAGITIVYDLLVNPSLSINFSAFWTNIPTTIAMIINIVFAIIATSITIDANKRFKKNKKPSPKLLSIMFLFLIFTMAIQVFSTMTQFSGSAFFSEYLSKSVWLFLGTSVFFQYLFILDIFKEGILNPKNRGMILFFVIFDAIIFGLMIFSMFNDYFLFLDQDIQEIVIIAGSAVVIFSLIVAFMIQATSSFKMMKGITEVVYRRGVLFIGLSGLCFLAALFSEFFEEIFRILIDDATVRDLFVKFSTVFSPAMSLAGGVLIYLGYIYPSKIRKERA